MFESCIKVYLWDDCPPRYKQEAEGSEYDWVAIAPAAFIRYVYPNFLNSSEFGLQLKKEKPGYTLFFGTDQS